MIRSLAVVLTLSSLGACGGQQKKGAALLEDLRRYHEGLRWRRYEDSAHHIPPARRQAFLDERDELDEDLSIDEYEISRVTFQRGEDKAVVLVKIKWHLDSTGLVHDTVVEQKWERRDLGWTLVGEVRKRGEPMPGLGEAPEPEDPEAPEGGPETNEDAGEPPG